MLKETRELLRRYGIEPQKGLGQHFLVNSGALGRMVQAAGLGPNDRVLEIGPGLGILTRALAEQAGQVVAVEIDPALVQVLQAELGGLPNVHIVQGNCLSLDPAMLMGGEPYKVVANLPYGITAAVLRHLLEASPSPRRMIVTVQREVAERIVAREGRMSILALSVHFYGQPTLLFRLKPGSFYPAPEVESAVLRIEPHPSPPVPPEAAPAFFHLVRAGFSQPRKQLRNSLAAGLRLPPAQVADIMQGAGLPPTLRAERLCLSDWYRLLQAMEPHMQIVEPSGGHLCSQKDHS